MEHFILQTSPWRRGDGLARQLDRAMGRIYASGMMTALSGLGCVLLSHAFHRRALQVSRKALCWLLCFSFLSLQLAWASPEEDVQFGQYMDRLIVAKATLLFDEQAQAKVEEVAERLAKASGAPGQEFTARILNSPTINAFSAPGGYLYVTTGLLDRLQDEDELAAVLAREVYFLQQNTLLEMIRDEHNRKVGTAIGIVALVAIITGLIILIAVLESNADDEHMEHQGTAVRPGHDGHRGKPGPGLGHGGARPPKPLPPRAHRHPRAVVHESIHFSVFVPIPVPGPGMPPPPPPPPAPDYDSADYIIQVGYGTAAEMSADAFAVNTLSKAGYDPWALIRVLDRLQKDRQSGALQWADSPSSLMDAAPGLQNRIAEASKLISPAPAPVQTEKL